MIKVLLLTTTALLLAGCASVGSTLDASLNSLSAINPFSSGAAKNEAPGPAAGNAGLNPQQARLTDARLLSDTNSFEQVQLRLRKLSEAGVAQNNYSLAKAQCWLDTALTQYRENDRTGYIEESLVESVKIVEHLERDKAAKAGMDTPLVARSSRLRSDLWSQLGKLKTDESALVCNARTVACAEVRLVRAGHAEEQTGWRSATPHLQIVEDAIRTAGKEANACAANTALQTAGAARAAAPVQVAAQTGAASTTVIKETFVVLSDALFKFDKYGAVDMLPGGLQRLNAVADRLKNYKSIESLRIVGHTDRLGSEDYNTKLSQQRADTVKAHFEKLGVKAAVSSAKGVGKREPVVTGCSDKLASEALIQCLQADRRVTIEVAGSVR
ncbi:MAG: OmpA family protein [Burkholderiales bacterium]